MIGWLEEYLVGRIGRQAGKLFNQMSQYFFTEKHWKEISKAPTYTEWLQWLQNVALKNMASSWAVVSHACRECFFKALKTQNWPGEVALAFKPSTERDRQILVNSESALEFKVGKNYIESSCLKDKWNKIETLSQSKKSDY